MKMFGIAYIHGWPCICFGKKVRFFKLIWAKKYHWFRWYTYTSTSKNAWWQRVNSYPFRFWGWFILPNEDVYDLD
jgi:hypothetical protein